MMRKGDEKREVADPPDFLSPRAIMFYSVFLEYLVYDCIAYCSLFHLERRMSRSSPRCPFLCPCRRSEIRGGGEEDLEFNIIAKDSRKFSARKDLKSFAFLQFLALFVFVFVSSYKVQSLISFKKKK